MSGSYRRIVLHIGMYPEKNPTAAKKAETTFLRLNNILSGAGCLPNINAIYANCTDKKLGAYIRNESLNIKKEDTFFDPTEKTPNSLLNVITHSDRVKIRVLLYAGERADISNLKLLETTHTMIIQFAETKPFFRATEPHENPPVFYQVCSSEEVALLYIEALLVDACLCHYTRVSDAAPHHDEQQSISFEKIQFLQEICGSGKMDFLSPAAQKLVTYVASCLDETSPYISFFSIFTIAPRDLYDTDKSDYMLSYFNDYCNLWSHFQKWYYLKHGRVFSKDIEIGDVFHTIFDRNTYQGQISPDGVAEELNKVIETLAKKKGGEQRNETDITNIDPSGYQCWSENLYAFVIIRHLPNDSNKRAIFNSLFSGKLYQAKWKIIHISELEKFEQIRFDLEIVPFIIDV